MTGQRNGQPCTKMAADCAEEEYDGQGHNPLMVRHVQVWSRASSIQLVPGGSAAVQRKEKENYVESEALPTSERKKEKKEKLGKQQKAPHIN